MEATEALLMAYDAWRVATQAEAASIEAGNWEAVADQQRRKSTLQGEILRWTEIAEADWKMHPALGAVREAQVRQILRELVQLERENTQSIDGQLARQRTRRNELNKVQRTLRSVHQSYGAAAIQAWQAYS
jgi:hypothetical protein